MGNIRIYAFLLLLAGGREALWFFQPASNAFFTPPKELSKPSVKSPPSVLKRWWRVETWLLSCTTQLSAARLWSWPCQPSPFHSVLVKQKMKLSAPFPLSAWIHFPFPSWLKLCGSYRIPTEFFSNSHLAKYFSFKNCWIKTKGGRRYENPFWGANWNMGKDTRISLLISCLSAYTHKILRIIGVGAGELLQKWSQQPRNLFSILMWTIKSH